MQRYLNGASITEKNGTETDQTELDWTELNKNDSNRSDLDWMNLNQTKLYRFLINQGYFSKTE